MQKTSKQNKSQNRHRILVMGILCLFGVYPLLQVRATGDANNAVEHLLSIRQTSQQPDTVPGSSAERRTRKVHLIYADVGYPDKNIGPDVQVLVGSVSLRSDSMYMYCDSALIYENTNSVEAFDNVRMEQGDTLFIYGDYLYYDGISQIAHLRNNVRMINRNTELTTDSLNYDRVFDLGYYFEGGTLTDEQNVLTSFWGEYSPATKLSVFNHDVVLVNPNFTLTSDTLKYHTETKIATILGPSEIISDENHIYSERGIYFTDKDQAELLDRSVLTNQGRKLTGDSLFYDRNLSYGEAFDNVQMNDTVNRNMLTGDYCYYNELTEYAMATNRAVAVDYSQGDSLFMHADTLKMTSYFLNTDSVYREMHAYNKVRMYRTDVQGVCDSLVYNSMDSCVTMYTDPILWNEGQQLLGEEIKIYMNDSTIDWAHVINQALTIEAKDSLHYNQVSGKEIKSYFKNGEMHRVDVIGNVLVVFYPEDDKDKSMIGMNTSETSLLNLYLVNRQMDTMVMSPKSNGVMYPMDQIPADKMRLPSFAWFDYIRPLNKDDIFNWRPKRSDQVLRRSTRRPVEAPRREINK